MYKRTLALAALGGLIALPACTSSNSAFEPPRTIANVSASQLQFQVGTANYSGRTLLNTVVTFRQPNGLSALLDDTPVITLPFTNTAPASVAGNDSGTNLISGSAQPPNGVAATPSTFGTSVGAYAYGFLPVNSTTTGANNSTFYPASFRMPIYGTAIVPAITQRAFYVGPGSSFVPNFKDGTFPSTFFGYPSGWTTFGLTPTTGTYSLSVGISPTSTAVPTFTSTTTVAALTTLPNFPAPVYTSNGAGGGTVAVVVPPGVTETLVEVVDTTAGNYYTLLVRGTGPQTATLASNLGVITAGVAGPSIPVGNGVRVIALGFDYPAIEGVPVGASPPQAPVINNAGTACAFSGTNSTCPGSADITVSPTVTTVE